MNLVDFDALSFDCYGTLIDWETGLAHVLEPWAAEQGLEMRREQLLTSYAAHEAAAMRRAPGALYPEILATAFTDLGEELGRPVAPEWAQRFAGSVGDWPAFDDSAAALAELGRRYKLVIVSNVHRAGFAGSNRRLGVRFDRIITAEDVGAYKPADRHFVALSRAREELGVADGRLLHVAQSLFHDHVPARRFGLPSVWINRRRDQPGWGATPEPAEPYSYQWEFPSMRAFADAVEADGA